MWKQGKEFGLFFPQEKYLKLFFNTFRSAIFCDYSRSEEFEHSQLDDKKWMDEYKQSNPSELSKTANELLGTINDPKLTSSEVNMSCDILSMP